MEIIESIQDIFCRLFNKELTKQGCCVFLKICSINYLKPGEINISCVASLF